MFCSCILCGWRRPQNGFQYFLAFRRRPAQICFDKLAGSSKSIVFFRVPSHMADRKPADQKNNFNAFCRSGATFFCFQIWQMAMCTELAARRTKLERRTKLAWRTKLERRTKLARRTKSRPGAPS